MPESYLLYLVLKSIIDYKKYETSCRYNDLQETKENEFGIIVSGNQVSDKRQLSTGKYIGRIGHVTFNYNSTKDRDGIFKGNVFMEEIRDKLVELSNKSFYIKEDLDNMKAELSNKEDYTKVVSISQVELLSDVIYVGKSKMEIPQYSLNSIINYTINKSV